MVFVRSSHWFIHAKRVEFCGAVTIQRALRASGALAEKLHMDIDYAAVGRSPAATTDAGLARRDPSPVDPRWVWQPVGGT